MRRILLLGLLLARSANAEVIHHHHPLPQPEPGVFSVDDEYYELTVQGLGEFMDDLAIDDPDLHAVLAEEYESLATQDAVANLVGWSSIVAGTYLTYAAFTFNRDVRVLDNGERVRVVNDRTMGAGLATILAGALFHEFVSPDRADLLRFINRHNQETEGEKIRFQVGLSTLGPGLAMAVDL